MQYPLYVHRNGEPRYRGSLPDFPGADASGNSFEELERNAREMVQRSYDGCEHVLPEPTGDTTALQALPMNDGEGLWLFVDIELAPVASRAVRVQINLHESVLTDIDAAAEKRHITRSAFIALACVHELEHGHEPGEIEGTPRAFRRR